MEERYEIIDVVASGSIATVWRARDVRLGRIVAIKRVHAGSDAESIDSAFTAAARSAAAVTHPNLVTIFDTGTDDTGPYLVMELVDGPNLAEAGGTPGGAAALGADVAAGLSALHAAGIVHRDVRPSNILLSPAGVKLTNFGNARTLGASTGSNPTMPRFEAPEVLAGGDSTAESDVYSLGAVLAWLAAHTSFDQQLSRIIDHAMSDEPEQRPTAATLAALLSEVSTPVKTTPAVAPAPMPPAGEDATRQYEAAPDPGTPPVAADEDDAEPVSAQQRRRLIAAITLAAVALVVAIVALAGGDREPIPVAGVTTTTGSAAAAATTPPADTETTSEEEPEGVFQTVRIFVRFIRDAPGNVLERTDAEEIVSNVVDAVSEAIRGNDEEATSNLSDATETIEEEIDSPTVVDRALELIARLAGQLGLDVDRVFESSSTP